MRIVSNLAIMLLVLSAGCRSYDGNPIDWQVESSACKSVEVRIASLSDAEKLVLVGNRELNAMRLKAANSSSAAKESGWWEDPQFDMDLMRIVNPSDNPFITGASVAFTIPLSGSPAIAAKAEELYAEADLADVRAAERDLSVEAKLLVVRISALRKRAAMLMEYDKDDRVVRSRANVEKLYENGEMGAPEWAAVQRQRHARHHALMETERDMAEAEISCMRLLGLHPKTRLYVDIGPDEIPIEKPQEIDAIDLVRHPKVAAALVRLKGSEESLRAEIRKQYPDLKLGPAYTREEGLDRFGLVAGITLPLWNRNRKGIAEAEGMRDEARLEAIDVWRSLVCDEVAARSHFMNLLSHPPAPANERKEADRLADAGELTPLDYLAVREQIFDQRLEEINWNRDVALAAVGMERFKPVEEEKCK